MSSNKIYNWFGALFRVWRREFYIISRDAGVMLFFFALPLAYPIVYTLIYNPEIVTDLPVALVDNCRTAQSRELARMVDATQAMEVAGYASDMAEARRWMADHRVYGIMEIPSDYSRRCGSGEQAVVPFYCDMSLLLRYRAMLSALTEIEMAAGGQMRAELVNQAGLAGQAVTGGGDGQPVKTDAVMIGDPTQGFASFVIPGILVLIIQQSIILGVVMLAAGSRERRRRNCGTDPLAIDAPSSAQVLGKMLCYLVLYMPLTLYMLHLVPMMFSLPHVGQVWSYALFIMPMLIASAFLGMTLSVFVTEREASMPVIVFTSVVFLFLSGLTWPRYAMPEFWVMIGNMVPAVWGVEGFIRLNNNGSTLAEQQHPYMMLWALALIYFVTACLLTRLQTGRLRLR